MFIKVDGTIFNFCKNKCHKNMIELKRIPRRTSWTQQHMREKSTKMSTKGKKVTKRKKGKATKAKKVLKKVSKTEPESTEDKAEEKKDEG